MLLAAQLHAANRTTVLAHQWKLTEVPAIVWIPVQVVSRSCTDTPRISNDRGTGKYDKTKTTTTAAATTEMPKMVVARRRLMLQGPRRGRGRE